MVLATTSASKYYIEFDGLTEMPIKSVAEVSYDSKTTGFENPIESTKQGKTNRQTTPGGFASNPSIKIEAYLCGDPTSASKKLNQWFQSCVPASDGGGASWRNSRKNASIVIYAPDGDREAVRYNIYGAWIKSYGMADTDATGGDLAVETYDFVCERIERVTSNAGATGT